jgi:predicted metal-dependent hydrolase
MKIEIIKSKKRIKSVGARLLGDTLYIYAPEDIAPTRLEELTSELKERLLKRKLKKELNAKEELPAAAERLNQKYFSGKLTIKAIEYSTSQKSRFGSCNPRDNVIYISHRLAKVPTWVRDAVIVHEMAHLLEPGHGPAFKELVSRYELSERAKGYLMALGFEVDADENVGGKEEVL